MTTNGGVGVESGVNKSKAQTQPEGFDRVFPLIGGHHRYQWLLLAVTSFGGIQAFHLMGYSFLGAIPDHWCQIDSLSHVNWTQEQIRNLTIPRHMTVIGGSTKEEYDQCSYYDLNYDLIQGEPDFYDAYAISRAITGELTTKPCSAWTYDTSVYTSTTVTTFNLVCTRRYLAATIQATFMGGYFVGSLLGAFSDRILGRRGCILFGCSLIIFGGFGATFATSYVVFILFRFLIAVGAAGSFQNRFTIMLEYSDVRSRAAFAFMQNAPFCFFYMLMAVYAYFIRDWRDLQLAFSVTTLSLISYVWIMPESSRWLASKNRDDEAIKILEGIAKTNRRPPPPREELVAILESCKDKTETNDTTAKENQMDSSCRCCLRRAFTGAKLLVKNYVNLVRTPELRRRSLIIWTVYIAVCFVYYGISFGSLTLSKDPFIMVFFGALMELPGNLAAIPLASKLGRRGALASTFLVSGLGCLAISLVPSELTWLRITLSMTAKLSISACFPVVTLLATELYPTSERLTGFGAAALMGRFGSISAPYVAIVKSVYTDLPLVICAIVSVGAGLLSLLLPETRDVELREYVNEVEMEAAGVADMGMGVARRQSHHQT